MPNECIRYSILEISENMIFEAAVFSEYSFSQRFGNPRVSFAVRSFGFD